MVGKDPLNHLSMMRFFLSSVLISDPETMFKCLLCTLYCLDATSPTFKNKSASRPS